MIYPRILALAETAWSAPERKSWQDFHTRALSAVEKSAPYFFNCKQQQGTIQKVGSIQILLSHGRISILAHCRQWPICRQKDTIHLHKGGSDGTDGGFFLHINRHIEAVVRDDVMLKKLFDDLSQGYFPTFDFQGKLRRRDGQASRQVFRNCIPDGSIDLMNLQPARLI